MAITTPYILTPYERRFRQSVLDLLFRHARVHTHLDWHDPDDWLDSQQPPMRLYWQGEQLMGVLAVSPPLEGTCWLRLAGVHDRISGQIVLGTLWEDLTAELHSMNMRTVGALVINEWLARYLPGLGFHYDEHIVTLRRLGSKVPELKPTLVTIRSAQMEDIDAMLKVDSAAFGALWRLSLADLRQAYRIAVNVTVALFEDTIVGYQISTLYHNSGHLARLAVLPTMQGLGVGSALVDDLVHRFRNRHVDSITVNTQSSNTRSQQLYKHYGFRRNGYDLAVWQRHF